MDSINYEELAHAVREKKASPEFEQVPHKEILSSVIRQQHPVPSQDMMQSAQQHPATASETEPLAEYAGEAPEKSRETVEELIAYTFEHGLGAGIEKAAKADPYVLDLYHDTLTDRLLEEMKQKELL